MAEGAAGSGLNNINCCPACGVVGYVPIGKIGTTNCCGVISGELWYGGGSIWFINGDEAIPVNLETKIG